MVQEVGGEEWQSQVLDLSLTGTDSKRIIPQPWVSHKDY
jgi:hypothetical protein